MEKLEKIMLDPFVEANQEVSKTRMRLLVTASISLVIAWFDLKIGRSATALGLTINGLGDAEVRLILIGVTTYLWLHFFWGSIDDLRAWKLRRSGIAKHSSGPDDPKQLTIYHYWLHNVSDLPSVRNCAQQLKQNVASLQNALDQYPRGATMNAAVVEQIRTSLKAATHALMEHDSAYKKASTQVWGPDSAIGYAIKRFDEAFIGFQRSQNYRWLLFEFLLPWALGLTAIGWLAFRVLFPAIPTPYSP